MIANPAGWTKQLSLPQGVAALSQVKNKSGMGESGRRGNPVAWVSKENQTPLAARGENGYLEQGRLEVKSGGTSHSVKP
jgi:hypothetical protein